MDTQAQPGSSAVSSLYARLMHSESPHAVLPAIVKATTFLARSLAQSTISYEDLRQEGLLACVLAAHSFDVAGGASFPTYALHCAQNRMLDYVRREKRVCKNVDSGDAVLDGGTNDTFFDQLPDHPAFLKNPENYVLFSELNAAITRLPHRERACIERFFLEETTQDQIAARLGVTRARVGQLLAQAIGRLRNAIAQ